MCSLTPSGVYLCCGVTVPFSSSMKVPRNATALKHWTLMDRRWKRKDNSFGSPVDHQLKSRARSEIKSRPVLLIGPNVFRASGMKSACCRVPGIWFVFLLLLLPPQRLLLLMYWQHTMLLAMFPLIF